MHVIFKSAVLAFLSAATSVAAQDGGQSYPDGKSFYDLMSPEQQEAVAGDADYVADIKTTWIRNVLEGETCPTGFRHVTAEVAGAASALLCPLLGQWDIVRLANGGSMSGPGYDCTVFDSDTRALGGSLCTSADLDMGLPVAPDAIISENGQNCPDGYAVASVAQMRDPIGNPNVLGEQVCDMASETTVVGLSDGAINIGITLNVENGKFEVSSCGVVAESETPTYNALAAKSGTVCIPVATE